ncbi:hypothetical protein [Streptomyces sp. NPDC000134]|uniref:hypothetical protein n=1 Tax=Streptomyces sp. NPDC000134 TaxID=3364536 RepID=UPI0036898D38
MHGRVADELNGAEPLDAVVHNAGVWSGPAVMPVDIVAPYLLTALLRGPRRLVYVSSGPHLDGAPRRPREPHRAVRDTAFRDRLVETLAEETGAAL